MTRSEKIIMYMEKRELNLDTMASICGFSRSTSYRCRKPNYNPSKETLNLIANGLGISVEDLQDDPPEPTKVYQLGIEKYTLTEEDVLDIRTLIALPEEEKKILHLLLENMRKRIPIQSQDSDHEEESNLNTDEEMNNHD